MRELNCSLEDYLLKWIGAVGQFVGLQLPLAMAIEDSTMH